jgi:hypothetical protein
MQMKTFLFDSDTFTLFDEDTVTLPDEEEKAGFLMAGADNSMAPASRTVEASAGTRFDQRPAVEYANPAFPHPVCGSWLARSTHRSNPSFRRRPASPARPGRTIRALRSG